MYLVESQCFFLRMPHSLTHCTEMSASITYVFQGWKLVIQCFENVIWDFVCFIGLHVYICINLLQIQAQVLHWMESKICSLYSNKTASQQYRYYRYKLYIVMQSMFCSWTIFLLCSLSHFDKFDEVEFELHVKRNSPNNLQYKLRHQTLSKSDEKFWRLKTRTDNSTDAPLHHAFISCSSCKERTKSYNSLRYLYMSRSTH